MVFSAKNTWIFQINDSKFHLTLYFILFLEMFTFFVFEIVVSISKGQQFVPRFSDVINTK